MKINTLGRMLRGRSTVAGSGRKMKWSARRRLAFDVMETRLLPAVSIAIDYSYDTVNFFNTQAKRDLMQLAADSISSTLGNSLTAIVPSGTNTWSESFPDPSTGAIQTLANPTVPANTLVIYAGGSRLAGLAEAGYGSTGGFNASGDPAWLTTVSTRGQAGAGTTPPTSFSPWGGSISFDSGSVNFYFGQNLSGIAPTQTDFLSVAEHEIIHVLGLGTARVWQSQVSGGSFRGPNAMAAYGGPVPLDQGGDHWAQGTLSDGGPALMNPILANGTRVLFTRIDVAGLKDLGWQVQVSPPVVQFSIPTYHVAENAGSMAITVTRTGGNGPFSVDYSTSDATATAGIDYVATSGRLFFSAGELVKTFDIPILNDTSPTGSELVYLALSNPTGGAVVGYTSSAFLGITEPYYRPPGDFDGDGQTDLGVFRPGNSMWFVSRSSDGGLSSYPSFGARNLFDIPVPGDYNGVGHPELAVFRPSTAQWIIHGANGDQYLPSFGATNLYDIPVPGDYDGVGHTQLAVFRPSTAQWIIHGPNGDEYLPSFGARDLFDIPVPGDYDGVGHTQLAVFRPSTGQWIVRGPNGDEYLPSFGARNLYDIPVPGDYDGIGRTEQAVFRVSTGEWIVHGPGGDRSLGKFGNPNYADFPLTAPIGSLARLRSSAFLLSQAAPDTTSPPISPGNDFLTAFVPPATETRHKNQNTTSQDAWLLALD
ncbi:MAG: hypothetical protein NVSMB9_10350 [Isosphaeraceae bacterium]